VYSAPVPLIDLSDEEVALIVEALHEAAFFRDARSKAVQSAVRRRNKRLGSSPSTEADPGGEHRRRAHELEALALKLRSLRQG
jgi:hypothetical protein